MINIKIIMFNVSSIIEIIFNHCNLIIVIFVKIIKIEVINIQDILLILPMSIMLHDLSHNELSIDIKLGRKLSHVGPSLPGD